MREALVQPNGQDEELARFEAELDALAAKEGIDERTGRELLLRLRERYLRRQIAAADLEHTKELQLALERIHQALAELA
jgi:hypothetical protein